MARYPAALVDAAGAGDRDAIALLLTAAQPDIRRYARRSCRSASDVEDAVQETLFVLSRRVKGVRAAARLSGWLFTVVTRHCLRLAGAMLATPVPWEDAEPEGHLAARPETELRIDLANAIQSLPEHYRVVVMLRDVQELTIDEIAGTLDTSRETVKARLHRARGLVREYLAR